MSGLTIYMEGGGRSQNTRSAIRRGMTVFLNKIKEAAREKSWHWKLVCCGSRDEAFRAFLNARTNNTDATVVLLVDAEGPVQASPLEHLERRDKWNLRGIDNDMVHLMTQIMETWIIADPDTLARYYGQRFNRGALPSASKLGSVAKSTIADALRNVTQQTQKGKYHKIHHASDLLKLVCPNIVRKRCSYADRLFTVLVGMIADG